MNESHASAVDNDGENVGADRAQTPRPPEPEGNQAMNQVADDYANEGGGASYGAEVLGVDAPATAQRIVAHQRLAHQSRVVLRLGQMMLSCGASAYRVKHSMARLAHTVGISEHQALVTYTEIVTTAYANGTFRTELAEQRALGINADQLDRINNYVESLDGSLQVEEVDEALDRLAATPHLYGWLLNCLASGIACAAFAFLNHGGPIECSVVAVAAFFGQLVRRTMVRRQMNHFGVWMVAGAVAAVIYVMLVSGAQRWLGLEPTHQAGFISAMLFLVPGFPLVTGIIDLVRQDFQAGISRLVYVTMLVASAGVAVWTVSLVFHWSIVPAYDYHLSGWLLLLGRIVASFLAAYGFAMLFNSPHRVAFAGACIGTVVNVLRLLATDAGMPAQAAVGLAALGAGLLAAWVAPRTRFSRVTLSVPAVVIMIPGVPLYRSLAFINNGQVNDTLAALFTVFFTILSIGVGLAISRMLTDRNWLQDRPRGVPSLGPYTIS